MRCRLAPLLLALGACTAGAPQAFTPALVVITVKPSSRLVRRVDGVQVRFETEDPVRLEMFDISTWKIVCETQCAHAIATGEVYRVTRQNRAVAEQFTLDAPAGSQITIAVGLTPHIDDRPSSPWFTTMY